MPESPLIVLVEDEEHLAQGLVFNLEAEGFRTRHFADGSEALAWLLQTEDDLGAILLDVMLPGKNGFDIVRSLREQQLFFPVLMLTARSNTPDILKGLNAGADDYLPKPFDLEILLMRLRTLLRRASWQRYAPNARLEFSATPPKPSTDTYTFGHCEIRFDTLELERSKPGEPPHTTHLTLMEADLLRYLTERATQIVSRKEMLEQVWRLHEDTDTRAIDNFIVRLRRYIEDDPSSPRHLVTVRGVGYRFLANP
jgi:DNA-binding response OmpR family regulator